MSYIRRHDTNPNTWGGVTDKETMYAGGKRRKHRSKKQGGKVKRVGMGIRAAPAGIMIGKNAPKLPRRRGF